MSFDINQIYLEVTNTTTIERLDNSLVRIRTCLFAQNMEIIKRQPYHTEHFFQHVMAINPTRMGKEN